MKKLTALISTLALLLSLCACSDPGTAGTESENVSQKPTASQAVSDEPSQTIASSGTPSSPAGKTETPEPSAEPSAAASETPTQALSTDDLKAIAIELSERRAPVSELYAAIGQPLATDYAPGCVEPDSEDGELIYSGFTVYTVRTPDREYVYDVL